MNVIGDLLFDSSFGDMPDERPPDAVGKAVAQFRAEAEIRGAH